MLRIQNSSTPTAHRSQHLPSEATKNDTTHITALTPPKNSATNVPVGSFPQQDNHQNRGNDSKEFETETSNAHQSRKEENTSADAKEDLDSFSGGSKEEEESGRERLKRHRVEVAGKVWIPDIWGQEDLLKDWSDCSAFDSALVPKGIMSARAALAEEGRRVHSGRLRVENSC